MKKIKSFVLMALIGLLLLSFFNNSFGTVDIEKMAIITAIGIDKEDDLYSVTAQIAVPEEDSSHTEKRRTHLVGKGVTVGDAIREISDITGWYPQLVFCNLLVIGKDYSSENVLTVLDYFAKTLRIQDSALVVLSSEKASDLLKESSPLDAISSFALQKILYKKSGFNKDVAEINIKKFCSNYYSYASSSYMPIINTIKQEDSSNSESPSSGGQSSSMNAGAQKEKSSSDNGKTLFSAKNTALFKNGIKVGELNESGTMIFNLLTKDCADSSIAVEDVKDEDLTSTNYLLRIFKNTKSVYFEIDDDSITLNAKIDVYCKIADQNSKSSSVSLSKNNPLSENIKDKLKDKLYYEALTFFHTIKSTECDILGLEQKLYRFHNDYYQTYKDNYLDKMKINLSISVTGQK
ncbi:MAG: hypothetical protein IJW43_01890 [Clostridia bacterium]|nr:hypothetical protein [Clostridia bacterium]